ncbi:hypothetical protein TPA0908_61520 [Micromonospora sp. AKA38]|nr:hypothetical protein TPA0908_61520 [Micromonospora sp. AKA38]
MAVNGYGCGKAPAGDAGAGAARRPRRGADRPDRCPVRGGAMVLLRRVIGDALRARRQGQHRTLREVSSAANVSLGYLSEIERGQKEPSASCSPRSATRSAPACPSCCAR